MKKKNNLPTWVLSIYITNFFKIKHYSIVEGFKKLRFETKQCIVSQLVADYLYKTGD